MPSCTIGAVRVVSVNVNGVRAAARRGAVPWLLASQPDVLCLQEVRASDADLAKVLADAGWAHWSVAHTEGSAKGRAGVAVASREPHLVQRVGLDGEFADAGRWVEVDLTTDAGVLTIASVYVHTGEAGTDRQEVKYAFLDAMTRRMGRAAEADALMLVTGDLNIAHREADLKNWKGNLTKSGFLEPERAYLDRWFDDDGWVDVHRRHVGNVTGPYTWWSWRGKAFDNDAGWRIDYQLATRRLAATVTRASVGRAPSYAERWSDHAPVVVDYAL
jgi:exodeoxyribonuclease-3